MVKGHFASAVPGLILFSILAGPVAARTIRTDYEGLEYYVDPVARSWQWVSEGGVLHIRGGQEAYRD